MHIIKNKKNLLIEMHNYSKHTIKNGEYNDYIKLFIDNFKNIYFTAPRQWSARGMIEYLNNNGTKMQ